MPARREARGANSDADPERGRVPSGIILRERKSETAKSLPLCKAGFVENQLDFTKVPLEVIGDDHPR